VSATYEDADQQTGEIVKTDNPNPFGAAATAKPTNAAAASDAQRAIAEIQAAMVIAQQFPRDQRVAFDRVITAFQRPSLAEHALYAYARGGTEITGPSIRAAEAIAQAWGNIESGIRELEQRAGESTVQAYAWDVETNTRSSVTFQVKHERHTRNGVTRLLDPRDIYELVANQGARRLRARILAIIPADVVDAAVKETEKTLRAKVDITPERIASLVEKFAAFGVPKEAIEKRIQRRMDTVTPSQVLALAKIYNSLNDAMSAPGDWFELEVVKPKEGTQTARTADKLGAMVAETAAPSASTVAAPEQPSGQTPEVNLPVLDGLPLEEILDLIHSFAKERGYEGESLATLQKQIIGSASITVKTGTKLLTALAKIPLEAADD
jgi:hypothetical protein